VYAVEIPEEADTGRCCRPEMCGSSTVCGARRCRSPSGSRSCHWNASGRTPRSVPGGGSSTVPTPQAAPIRSRPTRPVPAR